jgi:hypothetical protein
MTTMRDQLEEIWKAIAAESNAQPGFYRRRVADTGPAVIYAALHRPEGRRRLSHRVPASVVGALGLPIRSKGFDCTVDPVEPDATVTVHLEEKGTAVQTIFPILCADLIAVCLSCTDETAAAHAFARRLQAWKRFFEAQAPDGITREAYIGLWGELRVFLQLINNGASSLAVLDAWKGPESAAQDFCRGNAAVEVKNTIAAEDRPVRISNLRQLDDTPLEALFLVHLVCDFRHQAGERLSEQVARIAALIGADATDRLHELILSYGLVLPDSSPWADWGFTVLQERLYHVGGQFPRLTLPMIPVGITDVAYSVDLNACDPYRCDWAELVTNFDSGGAGA